MSEANAWGIFYYSLPFSITRGPQNGIYRPVMVHYGNMRLFWQFHTLWLRCPQLNNAPIICGGLESNKCYSLDSTATAWHSLAQLPGLMHFRLLLQIVENFWTFAYSCLYFKHPVLSLRNQTTSYGSRADGQDTILCKAERGRPKANRAKHLIASFSVY